MILIYVSDRIRNFLTNFAGEKDVLEDFADMDLAGDYHEPGGRYMKYKAQLVSHNHYVFALLLTWFRLAKNRQP